MVLTIMRKLHFRIWNGFKLHLDVKWCPLATGQSSRSVILNEKVCLEISCLRYLVDLICLIYLIQGGLCDWCPPKKIKYGKTRSGEFTLT